MAVLREKRVRALLGPTNTGKTHRAIEAMLRHKSGIFGLPLRLLAREVYERVIAATSPDQVALVTGEEKIIPASVRYWICTVEAMPLDEPVAFVGIDEVQLAEHRQRGHVFTDRILHCRGLEETVFMGSDRIRSLLQELVPGVEIEFAERFSELTAGGPHSINALPDRTAVVAFSASQVYQLAERLKGAHGGAAVVLGALSPRTRNAQVELYQTGRVKHLVATDAIGMGLNLDLKHVTLASLRKYDGHSFRELQPAEVGQIAGRAGRYKTPGSFGALRPLELDDALVKAVCNHRFRPVKRVFWRNTALNFGSIEDLHQSLELAPPHPALIQVRNLDDQHALTVLGRDRTVLDRTTSPEAIERLWQVCQVPDFRKTLTDAHLRLLRDLALHLLGVGVLPESWVADRIERLDRTDGDIETLMSRIAWIRTWTFVTFRADWVEDRRHWQEKTRAIEDRLSDALHEALTARFVDRFLRIHGGGLGEVSIEGDTVSVGGAAVGRLAGLDFHAELEVPGRVLEAVDHALAERVELFLADDDLSLDDAHQVVWRGGVIGTLVAGPGLLEPKLRVRRLERLRGADKDRIRTRLERWIQQTITTLVGRLRAREAEPRLRGLLYHLESGMGSVPAEAVELKDLTQEERKQLARRGVRLGRHVLYLPASLKPKAVAIRARLWSVFTGETPTLKAPDPSATAVVAAGDPAFWAAIGFPVFGGVAVRADVLESAAAELRSLSRKGTFDLTDGVVARLALGPEAAERWVLGLGYSKRGTRYRR